MPNRLTITRRLACVSVASLTFAACSSWRREPLPAPLGEPIHVLDLVTVSLRSGRSIELTQVVLTKDSVVGTTTAADWTRRGLPVERLAFAREEITETRIKSPSRKRTVVLVLVVSLLSAVSWIASLPIAFGD